MVCHLHLDLREPHTHLVRARLELQPRRPVLRFSLPGWTPGSYLIRDYVRQLEGLEVRQGDSTVHPRRLGVASWEVQLEACDPVTISYRVMAAELSVRTAHLTDEHGFLALAAVALAVEGERWTAHRLSLQLPPSWEAFVPLPAMGTFSWQAEDFDQLLDSPLEVGPHRCQGFAVAGIPHRWVSWGACADGRDLLDHDPAWLEAVEQVCLACCRLMGVDAPPSELHDYLFVLHLTEDGYGGLEHDHSAVLQFGRRRLQKPDGRRKLLQLVAHEYLHQWNVRRLRPRELTPYRYDAPVVVPTLWFAEGVTSYLDQLLPHAAGLSDEAALLEDLGADLSRYRLSPGRRLQSLRQSSEEAWVKLYKPDPHSPESQISYYLKGAVLALVLDLWLRRVQSSLPQVLRVLWQAFGPSGRGYSEADLVQSLARSAPDLETLLPQWLNGTEDPPLDELLADLGLQLEPQASPGSWIGCTLESRSSELRVQRVWRGGPAEQAGLMVGDELLALNGQRLRHPEDLGAVLSAADQRAEPLAVLSSRLGLVQQRQLQPQPAPPSGWRLSLSPQADARAAERRRAWRLLEAPP